MEPHQSASASVGPGYNMINANDLGRIVEEAVSRSIQSNGELARMSTELARMSTELDRMSTELDRMSTEQGQIITELDRLNTNQGHLNATQVQTSTKLDLVLAVANPLALDSLESVPVVGQKDWKPLSQDPKRATWTYIKYQKTQRQRYPMFGLPKTTMTTYLAVSAYHCAFPVATRQTSHDVPSNHFHLRFVELPREIASEVEEIGVYDPNGVGHHNFSRPLCRSQDIVVARLRNRPLHLSEESIPLWRNFRGPFLSNEARYAALVGRSLGTTVESVDGQVLFSPDDTGSGGMFTFNLRRGQPGDSGTLMFSFSPVDGKLVVGIFYGLNDHPNWKHERRGEGVLLPLLEELKWFPVLQPPPTTLHACIRHRVWNGTDNAFTEVDQWATVTFENQIAQVFNRCGVFVSAGQQSDYAGERDYARLSGNLLKDDDF